MSERITYLPDGRIEIVAGEVTVTLDAGSSAKVKFSERLTVGVSSRAHLRSVEIQRFGGGGGIGSGDQFVGWGGGGGGYRGGAG